MSEIKNPPPKRSPRIRPQSRATGQSRIRNLKCFQEVYDRILDGWTLNEVAKFIQDFKKELTDLTQGALVQSLQDFRGTIPSAELVKRRITPVFNKAKAKVEEGIDELAEMERLYKLQMERIEIDFKLEKQMKKLMGTTGQEVRIAKEVLSAYADLKMDLGLSKRHIGQMQVDARLLADVAVKYQGAPEVQEVMSNAQSRKKVLNLVERLLSTTGGSRVVPSSDVIDMVPEGVPADEANSAKSEGIEFPEDDLEGSVLEAEIRND